MDALRKAEESKKKVVSKASSSESAADQPAGQAKAPTTSAQSAPSATGSRPPASPPPVRQPEPAPVAAEPAPLPGEPPTPRQAIPDFTMDFDETEPTPSATASPPPAVTGAASESTEDAASQAPHAVSRTELRAEPEPSKEPSKEPSQEPEETKQQAATDSTSEAGTDSRQEAVNGSPANPAAESAPVEFELTPKEVADSRIPLGGSPAPDYSAATPGKNKPDDNADAVAAPGSTLALEVESPELPRVQGKVITAAASKSSVRPQSGSGATQTATSSPIRERSAGHQASARSVFSAKKPQQQRRRQQLLLTGAGAFAVLLLGVGVVYYLSSGSGSGITVPDNYVASQDFASGEVERNSETVGAESDELYPQGATLQESDASDDNAEQRSPTSQAIAGRDVADGLVSTPVIIPPLEPPASIAETSIAETTAGSIPPAPPEPQSAAVGSTAATSSARPGPGAGGAEQTVPTDSSASEDVAQGGTPSAPAESSVLDASLETAPAISFTRRQPESATEPQLNQAYAAFQQGDFGQARALYESVLTAAPLHRDALLGLAAIAVENQQPGQAMEYYSRLLARNPTDPVARTALLELSPTGGPAVQERELRRLQERHPGVALLAYSQGNFYASRQQWTDAQQHYFRALQLAKSAARQPSDINPDYAFNLAVSLEHLSQGRAALSFYREALEQSDRFPASFDTTLVRNRIESLSRTLTP